MSLLKELLAISEAHPTQPMLRNYVDELKSFCKYNDLELDASQSKFTVWKKFPDGKKWLAPFDDAEEAYKWLDQMKRQHTVKNAELPWNTPNRER